MKRIQGTFVAFFFVALSAVVIASRAMLMTRRYAQQVSLTILFGSAQQNRSIQISHIGHRLSIYGIYV